MVDITVGFKKTGVTNLDWIHQFHVRDEIQVFKNAAMDVNRDAIQSGGYYCGLILVYTYQTSESSCSAS
jgi:hypothetical protein